MSRKSINLRNQDSEIIFENGSMSEKVQLVANRIYKEFERMMAHFGNDVLECLMPLIVGVLENLDELYKTKQSDDIELEMIKEDNLTLANQYEKERSLRKKTEERLFDAEFMYEEDKKLLMEKCQDVESMLRIMELKLRSSNDLVKRLEEKEKLLKIENQKLYERYTETFKAHGDLLQRLKRYNFTSTSSVPPNNHNITGHKQCDLGNTTTVEKSTQKSDMSPEYVRRNSGNNDISSPQSIVPSRQNNLKEETVAEIYGDDEWISDSISESLFLSTQHRSSSFDLNNNKQENKCSSCVNCHNNLEDDMGTTENSLDYNNADSDTDLTDDEFGIRKEIENLIKENQDLVDTKNALNVVKDDLISRLDILTSENEMMREDIHQHLNKQADLTAKVAFLERELNKCKKELKEIEESQSALNNRKEDLVVEHKIFSRSDMAILLQERNHFKERLLELQDTIVYTETMRAKKLFPDQINSQSKTNNSSVWNLFKNIKKINEDDIPVGVEEKSKVLKTRFRLENNRSQLYSWSIPRALIESSLPKRIPIPIKIQKIFEPKDIVVCCTIGFEEYSENKSGTYLWCLTQSINKHFNLVHISLCSKQPDLIQKKFLNLQFPTPPFNMCEVPVFIALKTVIKELSFIRSSEMEEETNHPIHECVSSENAKITKLFHTKVHKSVKQRSKCTMGSKTLWFGCQKKQLVVFVLFDYNKLEGRMATANLPSEIDFIKYQIGRVFVMTKDGSICLFDLNKELNQWDLHQCLLMDITNGLPIASSCCDQKLLLLWLGSSANCFILNLSHLTIQKSWIVTEDNPSLDPCTSIESIVKVNKLSLMILSISRIGSVIGYDTTTFELKMFIDLRPCVFDLIEPVAGLTTLSLYHMVDDGQRLWMTTDCGMIFIVTLDCLKNHLSARKTKMSLQSEEVLISSHAFAQCVKSICLLTYSSSSLAIGDTNCSKGDKDFKCREGTSVPHDNFVMTAIGSCYVNLNNTLTDTLNLANQALIWKI